MQRHADSHLDHGLTEPQISYLLGLDLVGVHTVELPAELGTVPCALYGPAMGDPAVPEAEVVLARRGARTGLSRLIRRPPRPTRLVTVIVGPHDGLPDVLYTAFGGPAAPREPFEVPDDPEAAAFWAEHALSFI